MAIKNLINFFLMIPFSCSSKTEAWEKNTNEKYDPFQLLKAVVRNEYYNLYTVLLEGDKNTNVVKKLIYFIHSSSSHWKSQIIMKIKSIITT